MLVENKKISIEREIYYNSQRQPFKNHFEVIQLIQSSSKAGSGSPPVSYTHLRAPRDLSTPRMPSSA